MRRLDRPDISALHSSLEIKETYSDFRFVSPDNPHSSTSGGKSVEVIFAASRKGSEMIDTQNSFVSLIFSAESNISISW
jgi:hypothetical protein